MDTGSGGVEVEDVRGGEINVDTGSGRVTGRGLSATSLRIDTGSGRIELDEVTSEDVYLDTGSGSIRIELLGDVENLDIDTGSGSVTVWLPEIAGAELEVETGSGGIELDFPVQIRRAGRDHVIGTIGDGRGVDPHRHRLGKHSLGPPVRRCWWPPPEAWGPPAVRPSKKLCADSSSQARFFLRSSVGS